MAKYSIEVTRTTIETVTVELEGDEDTNWDARVREYMVATPDSQIAWTLEDITYDADDVTEIDDETDDEAQ